MLDLIQIDQHLLVEDVQTATNGHCIGVQNLYAVQKVIHALFDHIVDFLQSLQHLTLFKGRLVLLFK